ncbi:hypothetical protein EVAR_85036_1 [Eumeta japonica]|uniref:Uncharacterized protein n=1 Tax=Eumeta variegata TaxID=151549 RepID=A0A4C1WBB7_EUMVA|nr:hypothetical protein EVAR_85036_1 [Eumeta japonica]
MNVYKNLNVDLHRTEAPQVGARYVGAGGRAPPRAAPARGPRGAHTAAVTNRIVELPLSYYVTSLRLPTFGTNSLTCISYRSPITTFAADQNSRSLPSITILSIYKATDGAATRVTREDP